MNALAKVVWAEGVFLGQQHFQLWEQYSEWSQQLRSRVQAPFAWGLCSLKTSADALAQGRYRLDSCEAIFPDGRIASLIAGEDEPLVCELANAIAARVEIYLALPGNPGVAGIAGYQERGRLCGWRADYRQVPDLHDPARVREVMVCRPNLLLLRGDEPRDQFAVLKIAELLRQEDGDYQPVKGFIPAVCSIAASEALRDLLRRLLDTLAARVRVLDERRARLGSVADFGPGELGQFLLLQTLRPALALLQHLWACDELHPELLYRELIKLIAALQAFRPEAETGAVPAYEHQELSAVFNRLEQMLRTLLADAVPAPMSGLKLVKESDSLYSVSGIDSRLLEGASFFLAVQYDSEDPAWVADFARQVKVSAREDVELVLSSALAGVRVTHCQRPPNRLPIKSGYEYFRLEGKGEFWERALQHHSLGVFLPAAFARARLDMVSVEE